MAVNLISEPDAVVPVGNCIEYELELDDPGTGSITKILGYQVWVGGNAVTDVERIQYTGEPEKIDISREVRAYLATTKQQPDVQILGTQDTAFTVDFYIKYGEISFDSDTCDTTVNLSSTSSTRTAINAAFQWYEDFSGLDAGEVVALSSRPLRNTVAADQTDWLWFFRKSGSGSVYVLTEEYGPGGLLASFSYDWVSAGAHLLGIGPANYSLSPALEDGVTYYKLKVYDAVPLGTPVYEYTFIIKPICSPYVNGNELYWLEPQGGYASLSFDNVRIGGSVSSGSYYLGRPCGDTPANAGINGGVRRINSKGFKRYQLNTQIPYVENVDRWLDGLFASQETFLRFKLPTGVNTLARFTIADGEYQVISNGPEQADDITINVIGDLHLPTNVLQ